MKTMLLRIPSAVSCGSVGCAKSHDWQLGPLSVYLNPLLVIIHSWKIDLGPLKRFPLPVSRRLNFSSRQCGRNTTGRRAYLFLSCCSSSAGSHIEQLFQHPDLGTHTTSPKPNSCTQITPQPLAPQGSVVSSTQWLAISSASILECFDMKCIW